MERRQFLQFSAVGVAGLLTPVWLGGNRTPRYEIEPLGHRVVERGPLGEVVRVIGSPGTGPRQLNNPVAMAIGDDGRLYVADRGNSRIQVFDADGAHRGQIGSPRELHSPNDVALDGRGRIFVSDGLNHRVQVFETGGRHVASFGEFNLPRGLDLDVDGMLHVVDAGNRRVRVYTPDGAPRGDYGGDAGMWSPRSIAFDGAGDALVTDPVRSAVHRFRAGRLVVV